MNLKKYDSYLFAHVSQQFFSNSVNLNSLHQCEMVDELKKEQNCDLRSKTFKQFHAQAKTIGGT